MSVPVPRDANGRILKGHSLNPGGRPAGIEAVRELLRPHAPAFVAGLVELAKSENESTRLAAQREFWDRLIGKPVQISESDVRTVDIGAAFLQALQSANDGPAEMLDVTPPRGDGSADLDDASDADALRRKDDMHDQIKQTATPQEQRNAPPQPAVIEIWPGPEDVATEPAGDGAAIEW